eukprot:Phypoly_transcript_09342.p1 GENE.Phypoly_transcript_09342~~Phypoly_transcript_09342.p1  ORF type:complete len:375 (+),score=63.23 Phypoly_transcript_09342:242-1366(+)
MKVTLVLVLAFAALACAIPTISETFQAKVSISVSTAFGNGTGVGIWAADETGQVSIEEYKFDNNSFDTFSLNRYDQGKLYRIFPMNESACQVFPTSDEMPKTWDWLSYTKLVGTETFNGQAVDVWESTLGYSTRRLGVLSNDTSVPVFLTKLGTEKDTYMTFQSFTTDAPDMTLFAVPALCANPAAPAPRKLLTCMSSTQILANAQIWVDQHVPYNQDATYMNYRTDCSGYVSYTWQAGPPGLDTADFYQQAFPITKEELQPGDCMLDAGDHVCLFGGWTDENQTHYMAYEETQPCSDNPNWCGTLKHPTLYPYYYDGSDFLPYRFNGFCGASSGPATTSGPSSTYEAGDDFSMGKNGGEGKVPLEEQVFQFKF